MAAAAEGPLQVTKSDKIGNVIEEKVFINISFISISHCMGLFLSSRLLHHCNDLSSYQKKIRL